MDEKTGSGPIRYVGPDSWLVIEMCPGEFDYVPHYDTDGEPEKMARKHGGMLVSICGTRGSAIACVNRLNEQSDSEYYRPSDQ